MDKLTAHNPYRNALLMAGFLILCLLLMEGWLYSIKPFPHTQAERNARGLQQTEQAFNRTHTQLVDNSQQLATSLEAQLQGGTNRQNLYQLLQQYSNMWGITLFREQQPFIWHGFSFSRYPGEYVPPTITEEPYVDVIKQNNVISLMSRIPFAIEDSSGSIHFELFTTSRIEQQNALPIGQSHEFNLLSQQEEEFQNPAELSFFEAVPDSVMAISILSTRSRDSVGVAYIPPGETGGTVQQWKEQAWYWRSLFIILSYVAIGLLIYFRLESSTKWHALAWQILWILVTWLLFVYLNVPERWFEGFTENDLSPPQANLLLFTRNSIFLFFIADTIARFLEKRRVEPYGSNFLRTMFTAGLYGFVSVSLVVLIIKEAYQLLTNTELALFDLQIFPDTTTLIIFLGLALLIFSVVYGLAAIGIYLLRLEKESHKLVVIISGTSFLLGLLFLQLYLPSTLTLNWSTWLSIGFFTGILGYALLRVEYAYTMSTFSMIRAITLGSLLISLLGYPILKNVQYFRIEKELLENALEYEDEEDPTARQITRQMLINLENEFAGISQEDLDERIPFLQSTFNQTVELTLQPEWRTYSFNLQLIKPTGDVVADYSTDLNAPNWTTVFDLNYLSAATEIEAINKTNNRPIVQLPQLENSANYVSFYRGWIPIFSTETDQQIAWILCSVYREHPDFDKPIRAVLASMTYSNLDDSFLLMEYLNGDLARASKHGMTGHFPRYNELHQAELDAVASDSILFYSTSEFQQVYRNVLVKNSPDSIIKASTIYPNTKNKLFSFFRFSFTLLLAGLILIPPYLWATVGKTAFQRSNQRFEHRILDSFLVATLLFLGVLIATTHYAIQTQNKQIVRQDLFDKLEELAGSAQNNLALSQGRNSNTSFSVQSLVSPLDVDATYYENKALRESTTPQIYQQNLLPSILPFDIYHDLFLRGKSQATGMVELASQNLLIGYQSLLSTEGKPIAAVAIPTFLESPKYDQQLLETTSYLIVFYLFTFGIFVVATTLIAKRLTQPLRSIQKGLNKISEGEFDTLIPVKSDDEIGSLAEAYNEMVIKLKKVRRDLTVAEREAAWKEMAQQVAHEIKNPLTPMKLNVQHLERQIANGSQDLDQLTKNINKITRNLTEQIQTLNNIASDFSKFSKPIDQDFSKVDINEIISSVADLYQQDDNTSIVTQLTEYPINIKGAPDELRRVFINLVKNAFEAMPKEGGTITIKSYIKQGSAFFEIDDDGQGISEEDKSKIFVPNFSTKSSGTGLGLAICKKIVEAHNGSITFASIEGKGTTFIIKLPLWKK